MAVLQSSLSNGDQRRAHIPGSFHPCLRASGFVVWNRYCQRAELLFIPVGGRLARSRILQSAARTGPDHRQLRGSPPVLDPAPGCCDQLSHCGPAREKPLAGRDACLRQAAESWLDTYSGNAPREPSPSLACARRAPDESARRARALSRLHAVSHSWHGCALDHWNRSLEGLHSNV